jgi:choline-glycine betaine transporter
MQWLIFILLFCVIIQGVTLMIISTGVKSLREQLDKLAMLNKNKLP